MTKKTELEAASIVTKIEIASDEILRGLEITDLSFDALKNIKKSISGIHSAMNTLSEDEFSLYLPVLNRILSYVQGAALNSDAIDVYADRVQSHVEDYLLLRHDYDADYEEHKDQEMKGYIEVKRSVARIDDIEKQMAVLREEKINGDYSYDSAKYSVLASRYNDLEAKGESERYRLDRLLMANKENRLIRREIERSATLANIASLRTMSLEEFSDMAFENKGKDLEEREMLSAFERIAEEASLPNSVFKVDDSLFRKGVEETLLERLYKAKEESYENQITAIPKDQLYDAILRLSQKLDKVENALSVSEGERRQKEEETQKQLENLLSVTQQLASLREDICDDIVEEVEYCLSRNPVDLQSAQLKLRSCIELYCRYKKGVDLNDKLLFHKGESVYAKFKLANLTDHFKEIVSIYKDANDYVHQGQEVLSMSDTEKNKVIESVRAGAKNLKAWGIDRYDLQEGVALYYLNKDKLLCDMIKSGNMDRSFFERERTKKIRYHFDAMNTLSDFMNKHNIAIPEIKLHNESDIEACFNERDGESVQAPSIATEEPEKTEPAPVVATDGRKARLEGVISWFNNEKGFGMINNDVFCHISAFRNKGERIAEKMRVSYVMGEYNKKPCAKDIVIIAAAEMAE